MIGGTCDTSTPTFPVLSSKSFERSSSVPSSVSLDCSSNGSSSSSTLVHSSSIPPAKSASVSTLTISSHASLAPTLADSGSLDMKQDCESSIRLPDNLESIPRSEHFPTQRHRWNTNEEIAALLISFDKHNDWLSKEVKIRPKSGSMLLYSRKKVRYRRDGYCWKKRKDGKTTREDHMKLKVQGIECIYGCYVHSAILPTFHRRCYWLLQNPDIVLVHYLNVPYPDDNKLIMASSISLWADKKEWTKEELISQLKPMFFSEDEPDLNNELEISTAETVEAIVGQLMEKQRVARAAASKGSLECACGTGVGGEHAKHCAHHPLRRLTIAKLPPQQQQQHSHGNHLNPQQQQQQHLHNHHHSHHHQPQTQLHPSPHSHPHHNPPPHDSSNAVTSSRQPLDADANQVSSTSGAALRYQGVTAEGPRRPQTASFTTPTTPSSSPSPSNNNNTKFDNSNENLPPSSDDNNNHNHCNRNDNADDNSPALGSTAAPLILNLSNIQGGGGLLILNSGAHTATGPGSAHAQHPLAAPFTLTSYFGQPHAITSSTNGGARISHSQVLHSLQQQHHHHHHPHSAHNSHSHAQLQLQQHHQHHHQAHPQQQQQQHSTVPAPVLVKREAKEDVIENLRLDVTNGNLTMDSGTFANLVSSLDATNDSSKEHREAHRESLKGSSSFLASVKSELSEIPIVKEELFSDTLSLSPEDIQKTLSANLPRNPRKSPSSADDNPMDFIDSNMAAAEDDVLANLDAFDMLGDFPDLDPYDTSPPDPHNSNSSASSSTNVSGKSVTNQSQQTIRVDYRETSSNITDYSPEWAYPEGGVKVLVTGPWYSSTSPYTVLFDGVPTPTTLVQAGVLRCYCPAHEAGLVTLQVACDGFVISNSVIFEYKKSPPDASKVKEEESVQEQDDHLLKFTLLQRLETMETRVQSTMNGNTPESPTRYDNDVMMHKNPNFQDRIVSHCQKISRRPWLSSPPASGRSPFPQESSLLKGQTILHLAARLGYTRLIVCLLRWREGNSSLALEYEVDAVRKDGRGRTPLSWACLKGHRDAALILYRWNPLVIKSKDNRGATPLHLAAENGSESLAEELRRLQEEADNEKLTSPSLLRKSSSSSFVSSSLVSCDSSSSHSLNVTSGSDAMASTVTTDVFRRPSPRRSCISSRASFESPNLCDKGPDSSPMHLDFMVDGGEGGGAEGTEGSGAEADEEPRQPAEGGANHPADIATPDESRVFTLAEQIIAAIPERIKGDEEDVTDLLSPCLTEPPSTDLNMEVILDEPPDSNSEFNFELSDIMSYRYMEVSTPSSSLSPASSTCLPSPASFPLDSPSPPPTTADFSEFFQASARDFSKDFSNLTLSDQEQRELYEAAKIIQKAYRLYKGRQRQQAEKDKERQAAVLIQNYYRRYKQYAYFRQMSRAATLIQTQFRSYCESKRFKKSQEGAKYNLRSSREGTPVSNLKRTFSQRRQHQAARKIQQFMRQTKQKLQRERAQAAERETSPQISPPSRTGRAPSPALRPSFPPRGVQVALSSEHSRRITDPLLSTTAPRHHRTEKDKKADFGSF